MKAQFYNPEIDPDMPSTHNHYHQSFAYDSLNRLTSADYGFGADSSSSWFDVGNLSYDPNGNIRSLQRYDENGDLIDDLDYSSYTGNRLMQLDDAIAGASGTGITPTEEAVYEESLLNPWIDASWSASIDYTSTEQPYEESTSIKVIQDSWGSLSLRSGSWSNPVDITPADYHTFEFELYAPNGVSMDLTVSNDDGDSFTRVIWGSVPAGQWTTLSFSFDELNPGGHEMHRFNIREISGADSVVYYVDNIRLIGADTTEAGDWDAEPATFTYDANGNLIKQSGKIDNIQYDHRNLPVKFTMSDGQQEVVAGYNADGQRILKESSGGSWQFYVMDGQQTLVVIDQNGLSHMNLVGNSTFGRIVADSGAISTSNARRYYITDHLGSTRAVVDNNGNVIETFDYYPFGLPMPKRYENQSNTLERFTGKERDDEGELYLDYFGARYYDAAIGRWHSVDPRANDLPSWSPYTYSLNNPVNFFDPNGEFPITIHIRSFAPYNMFGAGLYFGNGANRRFTTDPGGHFKIAQATNVETTTLVARSQAFGSFSAGILPTRPPTVVGAFSEATVNPVMSRGNPIATHLFGNNDAAPGSFDIDIHSTLAISVTEGKSGNQVLTLSGKITGDQFPAAEAFISDAEGNSVFLGASPAGYGPSTGPFFGLPFDNKRQMFDVNVSIVVNKDGIFQGVMKDGNLIGLEEYNEEFEEINPRGN